MQVPVFVSAAEILARLKTVDSDASGLNATTLQGYVATDFEASGSAAAAIAAHLAAANPHGQYAQLATINTFALAQTLSGGAITSKIYPPSNSTNAFGWYRANGTTQDIYYNSTNGLLGVGRVPTTARLEIVGFGSYGDVLLDCINPAGTSAFKVTGFGMTTSRLTANDMVLAGAVAGSAVIAAKSTAFSLPAMLLTDATSATIFSVLSEYQNGRVGIGTNAPTAFLDTPGATTTRASVRVRTQAGTPSAPNDGDMRQDGTHCYMYLAGSWKQLDN